MQIDDYWERERRRILRWFAIAVIVLLAVQAAKFVFASVFPSAVDELATPENAARLQIIATIGNLAVGAILVLVTSFYAWITRATLHELTEARHSARRPMPLLSIRGARAQKHDATSIEFMTTVEVTNVGAGVLVRPFVTIYLPKYAPVSDQKWLHPAAWKSSNTLGTLPALLARNAQVERELKSSIEVDALRGGRLSGFLQAVLVFEDGDRNVYQLTNEYDLLLYKETFVAWQLIYERLTMQPAAARSWIHTSEPWDRIEGKGYQCLYERATPP